jgi:hypothetical protein
MLSISLCSLAAESGSLFGGVVLNDNPRWVNACGESFRCEGFGAAAVLLVHDRAGVALNPLPLALTSNK